MQKEQRVEMRQFLHIGYFPVARRRGRQDRENCEHQRRRTTDNEDDERYEQYTLLDLCDRQTEQDRAHRDHDVRLRVRHFAERDERFVNRRQCSHYAFVVVDTGEQLFACQRMIVAFQGFVSCLYVR